MIVQRFRGEIVPTASPGGMLQFGLAVSVTIGGGDGETFNATLRPEGEETFVTGAQVAAWLTEIGKAIGQRVGTVQPDLILPPGVRPS